MMAYSSSVASVLWPGIKDNSFLSLLQEQKKQGVIAASAGNHALALALHGRQLNIPVVVMMPEVAPLMKVHAYKMR